MFNFSFLAKDLIQSHSAVRGILSIMSECMYRFFVKIVRTYTKGNLTILSELIKKYPINTVRTYTGVSYQYYQNYAEGSCQYCQNIYRGINTVWTNEYAVSLSLGRSTAATSEGSLNDAAAVPVQVLEICLLD